MKDFIKKIFGQTRLHIPKAVLVGFKSRFKNAKSAEWSQRGQQWEVLFYWKDHETIAIFDASGELTEKRINISIDTLPPGVNATASQLGEVMNAIEINSRNSVGYEIIHRDANLIRYVAFVSDDGVLVSNHQL